MRETDVDRDQRNMVGPRAVLTERARWWACQRVGRDGDSVARVARDLGVGWHTVMRAVRDHGRPLVDDPARLDHVTALGVDEHVWQHAQARRRTQYATGVVDLTPGRPARLLDIVPGRTGRVYADWIAEREQAWRDQIRVAALDPFRGYATALCTQIPDATRVLDAFHVVALAVSVVDEVRRRVQQDTLGHRGHKHDPLYRVRRLLRLGADRLTEDTRAKLEAALTGRRPEPGGHRRLALLPAAARRLPPLGPAGGTPASRGAARAAAHLPDPRDRPARPHPAVVAGRVPCLLRYRRRQQRAHRGDEPARREDAPRRARLPQLRQLPAAVTAALRSRLADSRHATNPEPLVHAWWRRARLRRPVGVACRRRTGG